MSESWKKLVSGELLEQSLESDRKDVGMTRPKPHRLAGRPGGKYFYYVEDVDGFMDAQQQQITLLDAKLEEANSTATAKARDIFERLYKESFTDIAILEAERDELKERCDKRFDQLADMATINGLLEIENQHMRKLLTDVHEWSIRPINVVEEGIDSGDSEFDAISKFLAPTAAEESKP